MNLHRTVVSILGVAGLAMGAAAQDDCVGFDEHVGCGKACMLRHRAAMGLPIGENSAPAYGDREAFTDTDLLTVDLDIEIDPATGNIAGSNTMRVRALVNGVSTFTFMLRSNYTVSGVTINGSTPLANPTGPGANSYARVLTLDRAYNAGEEFTVRIPYSGISVSRGFGSIEFQTQGGVPIVASLSEAYFAGTWWPVKDGDFALGGNNDDKSIGRIAITAPNTLKTVSNGLLEGTDVVAGGKTRYRWRTNYQTSTYLYFFGTTNYNQWSQTYTYPLSGGGTGTMPVQFSIYPADDTPGNRAAWELCLNMLATYRPIFGEYPFVNEKYGIYEFPFGGGMEHQTYTGQGTFDEGVTSHELGHQWWGDNVTCKTWNHIWLNEGFATYTEALWIERRGGTPDAAALQSAMNNRRPSAASLSTNSVYVPDGAAGVGNMNRIFSSNSSYRKGGWVLHQLRHVIGDAAFFQTLQTYRTQFTGRGATTEDFRAVAEAVSGKSLGAFFQQWVYGLGALTYEYGWQSVNLGGQNYLKLYVGQTQDTTWGLGNLFEMPIDVRIDGGGTTTVVVQNNARTQHFLIPVSAPVTNVSLDEKDWILTTAKTGVAYVNGPAKVIGATPAIGSSNASAPANVQVVFSEAVNATSGAFTITGPSGGVPFTYAYNAGARTATLTPTSTLAAGTYTVNVAASITTVASGLALDGEIVGGALPSGNGVAGGAASWTFSITPACVADVDDGSGTGHPDGGVTIDDLLYYLSIFEAGSISADVDDGSGTGVHDGGVTIDDLLYYLQRFESGC